MAAEVGIYRFRVELCHAAICTTPFSINRIAGQNDPFTAITSNVAKFLDTKNSSNERLGLETAIQTHREIDWARLLVQLASVSCQGQF